MFYVLILADYGNEYWLFQFVFDSTWQSRWYKYKVNLGFQVCASVLIELKKEKRGSVLRGYAWILVEQKNSIWLGRIKFKQNKDLDSTIQLHHNQFISLLLSNHCSSDLKSLNQVGLTANCKSSNKVEIPLNCFLDLLQGHS